MEFQNFIKSADVDISKVSKVMKQYLELKRENPDSVMFFRLGDFYETYFEDALTLSNVCNLTLTKRKFADIGDVLMAGVPYQNGDVYISKLVNEKYKVTIVEQVQASGLGQKGELLERKVIRTYSPGTIIESEFLDAKENNYICSLYKENLMYGLAFCDVSTGEFRITEGTLGEILCELSKINPSELLVKMKPRDVKPFTIVKNKEPEIDDAIAANYNLTIISSKYFTDEFENAALKEYKLGIKCANAIINYAKNNQKSFMPKLDVIEKYNISSCMLMNKETRKSLEINKSYKNESKHGSLFWAMDRCKTHMGKRLLASWLNEPLYDFYRINARLDAVDELMNAPEIIEKLDKILDGSSDISRLSSKLSNGTVSPKEFIAIKDTLGIINLLKELTNGFKSFFLKPVDSSLSILVDYKDIIRRTIADEPSNNLKTGNIIKDGANGILDNLRNEIKKQVEKIERYELRQREITGINKLKIEYSKNSGYSIEIPVTSVKYAPTDYKNKQKLSTIHRFTTDELAKMEEKLLSLKLKSFELEYDVFFKLREYSKELTQNVRDFAQNIAVLDVLLSYAKVAIEHNFTKPDLSSVNEFKIESGFHPSLIELIKKYDTLDIDMGSESNNFVLLTGANMSGKSTYLRQIAITSILAQAGSYIPAHNGKMGLVDKIFARMGTYDDMLNNNSAFMCEMLEINDILNLATDKSLILLDETGKSTSYNDGISISYGISKYIIKNIKAKTVFATHFHSLNILENEFKDMVKNYKFVIEKDEKGAYKRRLENGCTDESLGMETALSAGLPTLAVDYAKEYASNFLDKKY